MSKNNSPTNHTQQIQSSTQGSALSENKTEAPVKFISGVGGVRQLPLSASGILELQRAVGNYAVQQMLTAQEGASPFRPYPSRGASALTRTIGSIQRAPVPSSSKKDEHRYHDDKMEQFQLIKEADYGPNEFHIKDLLQKVYWRAEDGQYYKSADYKKDDVVDVKEFIANKQFGAWMETYREASKLGSETGGKQQQVQQAMDMHVLQQFFSNALFSADEVARLDYQASPLNYQDEHSYIRAAATGMVEVLQAKLPVEFDRNKMFLAQDMEFRSVLGQLFTPIVVAAAPNPTAESLKKQLEPVATQIASYLMIRIREKQEFEQNKQKRIAEREQALVKNKQRTKVLDKEINAVNELENGKLSMEESEIRSRFDHEKTLKVKIKEKVNNDKSAINRKIKDIEKLIEDAMKKVEEEATVGVVSSDKTKNTKPVKSAKQMLDGLESALAKKREELEKAEENETRINMELENVKKALGVQGDVENWESARLDEELENKRYEAVSKHADVNTSSTYLKSVKEKIELSRENKKMDKEKQTIGTESFVLLRNYEKTGSLVFIDFSDILAAVSPDKIKEKMDGDDGLGKMADSSLLQAVRERLIDEYIATKFPKADKEAASKDIQDYLAASNKQSDNDTGKKNVKKTGAAGGKMSSGTESQAHSFAELSKYAGKPEEELNPLKNALLEISKPTTGTQKGLSSLFVSGGMLTLDGGKDGFQQPVLLVSNDLLSMQIKSALGKSGYVPTPTDAARNLLKHGVDLQTIVTEVIKLQAERAKKDSETKTKLKDVLKDIQSFNPASYTSVVQVKDALQKTKVSFNLFAELSNSNLDYVKLLAQPVKNMIEKLGILGAQTELEDDSSDQASGLPTLALAQLQQNLEAAVHNQQNIVEFVRNIQNLHEMIILALELNGEEPDGESAYPVPAGARDVHITHYGLTTFSQVYNGVMKQHEGKKTINIDAYYNIYFEMMQKLGHTQVASGQNVKLETPSTVQDFIRSERFAGMDVKMPSIDLVVIDIHPNDASQTNMHEQDVIKLFQTLFGKATPDYRCTVMIDITLNHIADVEVARIKKEAQKYIDSGQLNLVFSQSLTKFAQTGMDKHSGGLMFHYNDGEKWKGFNNYIAQAIEKDKIDPTISKYFQLLFQTSQKEQQGYIDKVRQNTRIVYDLLKREFAKLNVKESVISLSENDDPGTCYVAFHYEQFAAKVLKDDRNDEKKKNMARDILHSGINALADQLQLPLNMRTSFGFPLSNLGDIDPGIRLTVGIEEPELLQRYVQILTYVNGKISQEAEAGSVETLKDDAVRKQFLSDIVKDITTLEQLEQQLAPLLDAKKKPVAWTNPGGTTDPKEGVADAFADKNVDKEPDKGMKTDDPDTGIGRIEHAQNSCYVATMINLFASSQAYQDLLNSGKHELELEAQPANLAPQQLKSNLETREEALASGQTLQQSLLKELVEALKNPANVVTKKQVEDFMLILMQLGILVPPYIGQAASISYQQDAAEVLQKVLNLLQPGDELVVIEQSMLKKPNEQAIADSGSAMNQPILQLAIDKEETTSIPQALEQHCASEEVDFEGGKARKQLQFKMMPSVLSISLRRFKRKDHYTAKIDKKVEAPVELLIPQECLHPDIKGTEYTYRLVSFAHHEGSFHGGHYTAFGKNDAEWYKNDDIHGRSKPEDADLKKARDTAYMYVYELKKD